MPEPKEYPTWICTPCGTRYGKRVPELATYHGGWCGWCGARTTVTEPRDFGYPPPPLEAALRSRRP